MDIAIVKYVSASTPMSRMDICRTPRIGKILRLLHMLKSILVAVVLPMVLVTLNGCSGDRGILLVIPHLAQAAVH